MNLFSREVDVSKPLIVEAESDFEVNAAIRRAWGVERGPSSLAPIIHLSWPIAETEEGAVHKIKRQVRDSVRRLLKADHLDERALSRLVRRVAPPLVSDNQNDRLWILVTAMSEYSSYTQEVVRQIRASFPDFALVLTVPPGSSTDFVDIVRLASIPPDVAYELLDLAEIDHEYSIDRM